MSILFPSTISYLRRTGAYVEGIWTPAADVPLTFIGSCQPTTAKDVKSEETGRKNIGTIKIYSNTPLQIAEEATSTPGDMVIWQGGYWEVMNHMPYQNGLIPHYKYIAEYRGRVS